MTFLELLGDGKEVPAACSDDPRWATLSKHDAELDVFGEEPEDELSEGLDDECDDEQLEGANRPAVGDGSWGTTSVTRSAKAPDRRGGTRRSRAEWDERIRSHIREKSREELADLVCTLVERFPELRVEFQERIALAEGDVGRLVNQATRDLHALTAEVGWSILRRPRGLRRGLPLVQSRAPFGGLQVVAVVRLGFVPSFIKLNESAERSPH